MPRNPLLYHRCQYFVIFAMSTCNSAKSGPSIEVHRVALAGPRADSSVEDYHHETFKCVKDVGTWKTKD